MATARDAQRTGALTRKQPANKKGVFMARNENSSINRKY